MAFNVFIKRFLFYVVCTFSLCLIGFILFKPIFYSDSIIIPYSLHPYDICITKPELWENIKFYFVIFYIFSSIVCSKFLYSLMFSRVVNNTDIIHKKVDLNTSQFTDYKDLL